MVLSALQKNKENLNNYSRSLLIGKYTLKPHFGENFDTFSVPLRCKFSPPSCKFSTPFSLRPKNSLECKLQGDISHQKQKELFGK